ncbi:SIP domain-containing protein [Streptomyces sp. NPDC012950]|uniref:siderophore-interacting protein n=1 Tax=Streptomyces sp. NPDC012950 TaxID=3364858 RepID=UPI0036B4646B
MNAVAARLGVTSTAPYRHVDGRWGLERLVGESLLAELDLHDDPADGPVPHLLSTALQLRAFLLRHPGLAPYVQTLFPRGEGGRRLLAAAAGSLARRGYSTDAGIVLSAAVAAVAIGYAATEEVQRERAGELDAQRRGAEEALRADADLGEAHRALPTITPRRIRPAVAGGRDPRLRRGRAPRTARGRDQSGAACRGRGAVMARRGINGVIMRAYGARDHEATVTGTELLAPHFLRVRMASPTLLEDVVAAPAAYVRFWMPDPDDPEVEHQRGYTLSEADPASGAFAVDFVLHDPAGPASTWARRAEPGTSVRVTTLGSTRFDLPPDLPAGYLLIGDAASIPAINGILGVLPAEVPVELYLEEHRETDRLIPLADHPRTNVHRVPRRGEASPAAAIPDRDWSDRYVWTAPESGSLKHLRTRLRDEFGFPRSEMHAQAYWYYGRAFGSNRRKAAEEPVPAGEAAEAVPETGTDASVDASGVAVTDAVEPKPRPGTWRARAGGRLLAPLRPTLIAAGVAQALVTLVQLAPFVLMVELARRLLSGTGTDRLWALGAWAVGLMGAGVLLASGLLLWLHRVDARFARDLRQRLLTKLSGCRWAGSIGG